MWDVWCENAEIVVATQVELSYLTQSATKMSNRDIQTKLYNCK